MKLHRNIHKGKLKLGKNLKRIILSTGFSVSLFSSFLSILEDNKDICRFVYFGVDNNINSEYNEENIEDLRYNFILSDTTASISVNNANIDISNIKIESVTSILNEVNDPNADVKLELKYDLTKTTYKDLLKRLPVFDKVTTLDCCSTSLTEPFTNDIARYINYKFPNLKSLKIHTDTIEKGALESLTGLNKLELDVSNSKDSYVKAEVLVNVNTNFKELSFLDELVIKDKDYNIPIYFTIDEYNELINNGTFVILNDGEIYIPTYFEICGRLDEIVSSLNITEQTSGTEKINLVSAYILENFNYNTDDNLKDDFFYEKGRLYPIFCGSNLVCGNYSALADALLHRVFSAERCDVVRSKDHSWNIIDNSANIDLTWLDDSQVQILEEKDGYLIVGDTISIIDALKKNEYFISNWYLIPTSELVKLDSEGHHDEYNLINDENLNTVKIMKDLETFLKVLCTLEALIVLSLLIQNRHEFILKVNLKIKKEVKGLLQKRK